MIAEKNFNNNEEENSSKEENKQSEFMAEIISEQDYSSENSEENLIHPEEIKDGRSKAGLVAVVLVVVIGAFWIWSNKEDVVSPIAKVFNKKDKQVEEIKEQTANSKSWQTTNGAYSLEIEEQNAGDLIKIKSLTFAEDGWLVVYTDENDQPKNILSAYRFSKGSVEYWDMSLIKNLEANTKYHVVVFNEDGDRRFDYTKDQRVLDEDGQAMSVSFMVK